jgi:hypothetical protein
MDRYVYITSDESNSYFTDNQASNFKVHLNTPLILNGFWKVGLLEFHAKHTKSIKQEALYIFTDICKESILNGTEQPLLRRLEPNGRNFWNYILDPVIYLPVKRKVINEFEIDIKTANGSHPSLLMSPLHLTLHFKPYPFYLDHESF